MTPKHYFRPWLCLKYDAQKMKAMQSVLELLNKFAMVYILFPYVLWSV